jgi:hypothetical protein
MKLQIQGICKHCERWSDVVFEITLEPNKSMGGSISGKRRIIAMNVMQSSLKEGWHINNADDFLCPEHK